MNVLLKLSLKAIVITCSLAYSSFIFAGEPLGLEQSSNRINLPSFNADNEEAYKKSEELYKNIAANLENKIGQELDLHDYQVTSDGLKILMKPLEGASKLEKLNLANTKIDSLGSMVTFKDLLSHNHTITELNLSNNDIKGWGIASMADAFTAGSRLKILDLSDNSLDFNSGAHIAKALKVATSLQTLSLRHVGFDALSFQHLAEALIKPNSLTKLDLSQNIVDDVSAVYVCDLMIKNNTLKHLSLADCQITPWGAQKISWGAQENKAINDLNLANNPLKEGLAVLAQALTINKSLKTLDIHNTGVTQQIGQDFSKHLKANVALERLILEKSSFSQIELSNHNSNFQWVDPSEQPRQATEGTQQRAESLINQFLQSVMDPAKWSQADDLLDKIEKNPTIKTLLANNSQLKAQLGEVITKIDEKRQESGTTKYQADLADGLTERIQKLGS